MRGIDIYAIVAVVVTVLATLFLRSVSRARGPSRGHGGVYAALLGTGVWAAGTLHGLVVSIVALARGPTPTAWACAGAQGLLLLIALLGYRK
ncbi:MAG TPA: hypothetical protein VF950_15730 [Planctomycetota bacterium]